MTGWFEKFCEVAWRHIKTLPLIGDSVPYRGLKRISDYWPLTKTKKLLRETDFDAWAENERKQARADWASGYQRPRGSSWTYLGAYIDAMADEVMRARK